MTLHLLLSLAGLVALVLGADVAVAGSRRLALRLGVSELVIGLTVTSIGTSLPELATTMAGALSSAGEGGAPSAELAVGNILGSNIFLLSAMVGVAGMVRALQVDAVSLRRDAFVLGVLVAGFVLLALDGVIGRADGAVLLAIYVGYLAWLARGELRRSRASDAEETPPELAGGFLRWVPLPGSLKDGLAMVGGLVVLGLAADLMVDHGVAIAELLGVSGLVIGVLAGIGTSVPEVVVTVRSARLGASDLSVGNVMGSAITNVGLCLGLAALSAPLAVSSSALWLDVPFVVAVSVMGVAAMFDHKDVTRTEGVSLVTLFALYLFLRMTAA